ncbi:hypothetical protein TYRP_013505 [Tyrophagus putrescentiae]|nr:hypothetical protein TYRP_013505 [Tyrophagus putrescentiae]
MTTTCGLGSWRPQWLQPMANAKLFLLNLCLIGIVQSMAGALQFSIMNSLEKRFAFDSKISAVINIADNFSVMFLSPLIGYWAPVKISRQKSRGKNLAAKISKAKISQGKNLA